MTSETTELRYLRLLARQYPTIRDASTEIIRLSAILDLPKGTEHFVSDIHGAYEAFLHVLKNGSGAIRRKIEERFGDELSTAEKRDLAALIYYPEQKLPLLLAGAAAPEEWSHETLVRLVVVCRDAASKYTRSTVAAALPAPFADIIQELLYPQETVSNREAYYARLLSSVIETGSARAFIIALSELIQRLVIARLHVIGDVYDRGPGAHIIMDRLLEYHSVDVQWGNHDIVWMGAAAGSDSCIANVVRLSLRYANLETLENGYAISLLPLASFALTHYGDDPCTGFIPRNDSGDEFTENELLLMARMHKAITVIQLKLEGALIRRRPQFEMEGRNQLHRIDRAAGTVTIDGTCYPLLDPHFPTLEPDDPYRLTDEERLVVERLALSFANSQRLQRHVRFLFSRGEMYRRHNGNLLYHGCIPMEKDGRFHRFRMGALEFEARSFMDHLDRRARQGYFEDDPALRALGQDVMWYLWCGPHSPLFGKSRMATFERYFIADARCHTEEQNAYYQFRDEEATARRILEAFDLNPAEAHIVNGHVPVRVGRGERPVKANGRLIVIDGGFSSAYQATTGIGGYTLIYNSYGLLLAAHEPFESTRRAVEEGLDLDSRMEILESSRRRLLVRDTDRGEALIQRIDELRTLVDGYRDGRIKENDQEF